MNPLAAHRRLDRAAPAKSLRTGLSRQQLERRQRVHIKPTRREKTDASLVIPQLELQLRTKDAVQLTSI